MYKFNNNILTKLVYVVQFERGTIKVQLQVEIRTNARKCLENSGRLQFSTKIRANSCLKPRKHQPRTPMSGVVAFDYVHTGPDEFKTVLQFVRSQLFTRNRTNYRSKSVHTEPDKFVPEIIY